MLALRNTISNKPHLSSFWITKKSMRKKWLICSVVSVTVATISNIATAESKDTIQLGSPALTQGISNGPKVSISDIEKFLADPKNHERIEVVLPENLQAGKDSVYVPDDNPITRAKVELGRQLYFDKRLSVDGTISCADCHSPKFGYGFESQFGIGVRGQLGNRNSPVSFNRILSRAQFWDGRADSLEAQAIGPMANPIEMGNTHESVVKYVVANKGYNLEFQKIFGRAPNIEDVGKAVATFERVIVTNASPYDLYEPVRKLEEAFPDELEDLDALKKDDPELYSKYTAAKAISDRHPMSEAAKRGRTLFFSSKSNCSACHFGVNFTDEKFHNLGIGMDAKKPDLGRYEQTKEEVDKGAFKTPTVRNVSMTAPYMHDGSLKTLEEVVEWYDKGGHPNKWLSDKIKKLDFDRRRKIGSGCFHESVNWTIDSCGTGKLPE